MKNLRKFLVFLVLLVVFTLFFSSCLSLFSLLETSEPAFDYNSFQDNPNYRDELVGVWIEGKMDSGNYQTREFKSNGTGSYTTYKDNNISEAGTFRYKVSDFQVAFYFLQNNQTYRADYVITDNTLSLVKRSDKGSNRVFNKKNEIVDNGNEVKIATRKAADTMIKSLKKEARILIVSITSNDSVVSEYIAGELEYFLVNNKFTVVDRKELDLLRGEKIFQLSGEVDDTSAVEMGKNVGASIIISGAITGSGNFRTLDLRALDTQTAIVVGRGREPLPDTVSQQTGTTKSSSKTVSYKIGDRGPAGGIIFYDKGEVSDGWRYLEVAPKETEFTAQWSTLTNKFWPDLRDGIGWGKKNTENINNNSDSNPAALSCAKMKCNGFNDWFLPSLEELDLIYKNLKKNGLGGFSNSLYWSSSVVDKGYRIYYLRFDDGRSNYCEARDNLLVRAIRSF